MWGPKAAPGTPSPCVLDVSETAINSHGLHHVNLRLLKKNKTEMKTKADSLRSLSVL